jgi:hypothetical protein
LFILFAENMVMIVPIACPKTQRSVAACHSGMLLSRNQAFSNKLKDIIGKASGALQVFL